MKERGQEAATKKLGWDTEARARRVASCEDLGPQELSRALPGGQSPEVLPCDPQVGEHCERSELCRHLPWGFQKAPHAL